MPPTSPSAPLTASNLQAQNRAIQHDDIQSKKRSRPEGIPSVASSTQPIPPSPKLSPDDDEPAVTNVVSAPNNMLLSSGSSKHKQASAQVSGEISGDSSGSGQISSESNNKLSSNSTTDKWFTELNQGVLENNQHDLDQNNEVPYFAANPTAAWVPGTTSIPPRLSQLKKRRHDEDASSSGDSLRSIVDDLTIKNKKLKAKLRKLQHLNPAPHHHQNESLQIFYNEMPRQKRQKLEEFLRNFSADDKDDMSQSPDSQPLSSTANSHPPGIAFDSLSKSHSSHAERHKMRQIVRSIEGLYKTAPGQSRPSLLSMPHMSIDGKSSRSGSASGSGSYTGTGSGSNLFDSPMFGHQTSSISTRPTSVGSGTGNSHTKTTLPIRVPGDEKYSLAELVNTDNSAEGSNRNYLKQLVQHDPRGEGWVHLNQLTTMAQLHTMNVTLFFVQDSIRMFSRKLQLSEDGSLVRWRDGGSDIMKEVKREKARKGEHGQPGKMEQMTAEDPTATHEPLDHLPHSRSLSSELDGKSSGKNSGKNSGDRSADALIAGSMSSGNGSFPYHSNQLSSYPSTASTNVIGGNKSSHMTVATAITEQTPTSSIKQYEPKFVSNRRNANDTSSAESDEADVNSDDQELFSSNGAVTYYHGGQFCTDLSKDVLPLDNDGSVNVPVHSGWSFPSYVRSTNDVLGRNKGFESMYLSQSRSSDADGSSSVAMQSDTEMATTTPDETASTSNRSPLPLSRQSLPEPAMNWDDLDENLSVLNISSDSLAAASNHVHLRASGLHGVFPEDNFAIHVETQYSRSNRPKITSEEFRKLSPSVLPAPSLLISPSTSEEDSRESSSLDESNSQSLVSSEQSGLNRFGFSSGEGTIDDDQSMDLDTPSTDDEAESSDGIDLDIDPEEDAPRDADVLLAAALAKAAMDRIGDEDHAIVNNGAAYIPRSRKRGTIQESIYGAEQRLGEGVDSERRRIAALFGQGGGDNLDDIKNIPRHQTANYKMLQNIVDTMEAKIKTLDPTDEVGE